MRKRRAGAGKKMAAGLYRAVLALCPRAFREQHGAEMCATFDALCDEAGARGGGTVILVLAGEVWDVAVAAVAARIDEARTRRTKRRTPVSSVFQDVRYAIRLLRRQPTFTAVAVLTLALGIGANTAVFTVVNGVLLRPLAYRDPDRLLLLLNGRNGRLSSFFSPPNYHDIVTDTGVFVDASAFTSTTANLTGHGDPQRLEGADVTWTFFSVLGITPRHGRAFVETDLAGDAAVVVVSEGLWRRQLGGGIDVIGSTVRLDGRLFTVVGVAPAGVTLPNRADFWRPLVFTPDQASNQQRGAQWVGGIARLGPGVTLQQANHAMGVVADRLGREFPRTNRGRSMSAMPLQERIVRGIRPALLVLLGAVSCVLLIACVNVANLLLARAYGRVREVAVRAAVGASRARLVQQFLVESVMLGLAGGVAGLVVAFWSTRLLVMFGPESIPRLADVGIDWRVLAFTVAIAVATSVLFGLVPALAATGDSAARGIATAGRGSAGHRGTRIRKALVVCEMALAVVLLVGAGLLIRSYARLSRVDAGFSPDRVLTFNLALPEAKYTTSAAVGRFVTEYVQRLAGEPGVSSAAAVYGLPLDGEFSASSSFTRPGEADSADSPSVGMRVVTPDYFKTLRIPLRAGRTFDAHDDERGPEVVVINEEAAKRYWPGRNPIGELLHLGVRLASGVRSGQKTIVGVIGDVKYGGLDLTAPPEVYLPYAQHPVDGLTIAVRTAGDPLGIVPSVRADLAALDRELPIANVRTMDEVVGRSIAERRFTMILLAAFATVAVLLAAIGVYGVLAYLVNQRAQEIGVRLAIGAAPADVVRLFLREGAALALAGLIAGLAGALAATHALTTLLFGVTPTDPITFASVAAGLAGVALLATYLPARRAASVDPMRALRED
jgi:putative ABC transport system permease protein